MPEAAHHCHRVTQAMVRYGRAALALYLLGWMIAYHTGLL